MNATITKSPDRQIAKLPNAPTVLHARVVTGSGGGPDKTILRSARYAEAAGYRMAAAYLHPPDDPGFATLTAQAERTGMTLYPIAERHALDPSAVRRLYQLCRSLDVAIWHAHDYKSDLLGLLLAKLHPMKLVTTVHGFTRETWRTRLYAHADNRSLRHYDHVLAVSPPLVEHCRRHGVSESRLSYVPNGIELSEYEPSDSPPFLGRGWGRAEWPDGDRRVFRLGVVGRLSIEKGPDRAIRTLAELRKTRSDVELHFIGDGPQREALQMLARDLGVADAVYFQGWQSDTRPYYEATDLLLLPSRTEGLPNAVLEAMAMGVPVAAADVGGVRDLLDDGKCGLVLPNIPDPRLAAERSGARGEPLEMLWAEILASLLNDGPRCRAYVQDARHRVETEFSFDQRMSRVLAIYDRVLHQQEHRRIAA